MQPNEIMYIDLADPLPKSYAPIKGEEMKRSTYSSMVTVTNIGIKKNNKTLFPSCLQVDMLLLTSFPM